MVITFAAGKDDGGRTVGEGSSNAMRFDLVGRNIDVIIL